ncbi:Prefoldin-domain-containing protein, partial [Haematococcus lacustris]
MDQLSSLDHQQLAQAKQKIESDIQRFAESMHFLSKSAQIYMSANVAIKSLSESKTGQPLLLPLTQSVYVSGEVASVEEVLVDVGTGYFVEMTTSAGQEFCERKASKLRASIKEIQEVLRQKQNQLLQVEQVLQHKLEGAQQGTAS